MLPLPVDAIQKALYVCTDYSGRMQSHQFQSTTNWGHTAPHILWMATFEVVHTYINTVLPPIHITCPKIDVSITKMHLDTSILRQVIWIGGSTIYDLISMSKIIL